jgi:flagellar biosynthesis anti-sigma factor FlgM
VQTLKEALGSTPDLRQQRVEALRQSISDGSFQVAREHIAEAMLAEARWRA